MKEIIDELDECIEQEKKTIEILQSIRNDLHQSNLDNFIEENYEKIYEAYCDCYPEKIHSDFELEDLDYGDLCEFVEEHLF